MIDNNDSIIKLALSVLKDNVTYLIYNNPHLSAEEARKSEMELEDLLEAIESFTREIK